MFKYAFQKAGTYDFPGNRIYCEKSNICTSISQEAGTFTVYPKD
jgi:hypothetical protein